MATGEKTIVIQPGSRNLKIGLAKDAFPKIIPHVIARKVDETAMDLVTEEDGIWRLEADELKDALALRNKLSRKKQPPNIYASLQTYNKSVESQNIPLHNDSYAIEWTETENRRIICGKEALRLDPAEGFELTWPIKRGTIDRSLYDSYRDAIGDLEIIWKHAIKNNLKITEPLSGYSAMLVVPATMSRWELRAYTELALSYLGFGAVSFMVESVACTFGAGISSGCVVDLGAQTISVACVEDGSVVSDSTVKLDFGGDDVTDLLHQILRLHSFPYELQRGLNDPLDFELLNDLRERFCTLDDEDIQSLIYEFYVRRPGKTTLLYNFKVIEERLLAVQAMLDPSAPWLVPIEKDRRALTIEKIMRFATGSYDVEREAEGSRNTAGSADNSADVDMVDMTEQQIQLIPNDDAPAAEASQDQSAPVQLFECKWQSCKAEPFSDLSVFIEHIKTEHSSESSCKWNGCNKAMPGSEISRIGHLMDHLNDTMIVSPPPEPTFVHVEPSPRPIEELSLEEAIWKCCSTTGQLKSLSSILLIGGLSQTPGLAESLFQLLSTRLQDLPTPTDETPLPRIEFVGLGKDLDPSFYGWKGGAVSSKLESTLDSWITAEDWSSWGVKILRERLPF